MEGDYERLCAVYVLTLFHLQQTCTWDLYFIILEILDRTIPCLHSTDIGSLVFGTLKRLKEVNYPNLMKLNWNKHNKASFCNLLPNKHSA